MLTYEELKNNARKFVSLTSLTPEEFEILLPAFERAYQKVYPVAKTMTGKNRERKAGGGRKGMLASIEQKLLFALVYQKSYPDSRLWVNCLGWVNPKPTSGGTACCRF
jgi:hypothetical protein